MSYGSLTKYKDLLILREFFIKDSLSRNNLLSLQTDYIQYMQI